MILVAKTDEAQIWYESDGAQFAFSLRGGGGQWDSDISHRHDEVSPVRTLKMFRDGGFELTPEGETLLSNGELL